MKGCPTGIDQADHAVSGKHLRRRIRIPPLPRFRRYPCLDEIIDAERDRRDQHNAEEFKAREHMSKAGSGTRTEVEKALTPFAGSCRHN